jgi:hypothetical protein
LASSGIISGIGFAIAKIIGSEDIDLTISEVNAQATDTQTKTSLHLTASAKTHFSKFLFVISARISFSVFKFSLHL